ncbi:hypothetical protein [Amycolatopsis thermophila]|uniref:Uncharacterized protein n=1 Tax=Amycolatopsis thermophila TaxID=206084 RepID=A0ABU0F4F5_9PSEU|nr:hypothetical protein [Amycolatopsis thermophila]MDQ0382041.1 hypothetical protein [Amycolatopsis thermophila]
MMTSPGATAGTPGGYGLIVSALIRPIAFVAGTSRWGRSRRRGAAVLFELELTGPGKVDPLRRADFPGPTGEIGDRGDQAAGGLLVVGDGDLRGHPAVVGQAEVEAVVLAGPCAGVVPGAVQAGEVQHDLQRVVVVDGARPDEVVPAQHADPAQRGQFRADGPGQVERPAEQVFPVVHAVAGRPSAGAPTPAERR